MRRLPTLVKLSLRSQSVYIGMYEKVASFGYFICDMLDVNQKVCIFSLLRYVDYETVMRLSV